MRKFILFSAVALTVSCLALEVQAQKGGFIKQGQAVAGKGFQQGMSSASNMLPKLGTGSYGSSLGVLPQPKPQPAPIRYNQTNVGTARGGTLYQSRQGQNTVVYPRTNSARPMPTKVYRPPNTTQIYTKNPGTQKPAQNYTPIRQNPNFTPYRNVQPQPQQPFTAKGSATTRAQSGMDLYNKVYGNGGTGGGTARGR